MAVADQRILRGVAASLSWQNVDADGTAAAPAGTVTVGIVKADGTTLIAAGTATAGTSSSPRTYALTAANNTALDLLTVTWTDGGDSSTHTTLVEVVGGYYFSVAEARASDKSLTDQNRYPDADIIAKRRDVEERFETILGYACVPRYARQTFDGTGNLRLPLPPYVRAVRSVRSYSNASNYVAWTAAELAELQVTPTGVESRTGQPFGAGWSNLVVEHEHGLDRPPAVIKTKALQYLRFVLNENKSGIPDRATSFSISDGGTYRLDMPGPRKTGIPDIDAVLEGLADRDLIRAG